jgi:molecular chaperone Hsp33
MHDRDCLHRFMFEHFPIRGHLVHLDAAWAALIEHRDYPPAIRDTLGETVAACLLLAATVKFEGVLSLQLEGDGPVQLMLAQCTNGLGVRGLARFRDGDETGLLGAGNLTVTVENDAGGERYQGIVPITGPKVAEALQVYFENSEQLPTRLWLHADANGASGMLLQKLPNGAAQQRAGAIDIAAIDDAWRRVQLIGETLTHEELRT